MGLTYFIYGASRGVGLELVQQLSAADSSNIVIGTQRTKSAGLTKLASERKNVHIVTLDVVGAPETLEKLPENIKQFSDKVDVFVANASVMTDVVKPIVEVPANVYMEHLQVNAVVPIQITAKLQPLLKAGSAKKVIFVSSMVAGMTEFFPVNVSAYGVSKAALNYASVSLASEWKADGFKIAALHPGVVRTDMFDDLLASFEKDGEQYNAFSAASISPQESTQGIVKVIEGLSDEQSGKFLNYDGSELKY